MKKYVLNTASFVQMLCFGSDYDIAQRQGTIEVAAEDYANFIADQTAHFVEALMKEMECVEPLNFEEMVELYGSYYDEKDRLYTICPECGGHIYKTDWEPECSCCDCGYTENEEDY